MLILAREYAGYTQTSLSKELSFTQATLSRYESGLLDIHDEHLAEIARILHRPLSFFYRQERLYGASGFYHRKRTRLSMKELKRIHAQVNDLRIQSSILLQDAEIESAYCFHRLGAGVCTSPEDAARRLRHLWQLPTGPIRNVVASIEEAGGIVFCCEFGTPKVDGISQWPLDDPDSPPVLFVNEAVPGDRQRFTLSHEIGHIAMHYVPSDGDEETEADRFASEFLMPADEIRHDLRRLTLEKASALKPYWKVSMAALVRRAHDLKMIPERRYRHLNMLLSKYGYRKVEPCPIPKEEPRLFDEIIEVHRTHHRHLDSELAGRLGLFEDEFQDKFGHGLSGLRLVV
jgi:Zn-dependent peptidase ImmA (M78 family)